MVHGVLVFLVASLVLAAGEKVRYDDHRVYRVLPANVDQLQFLNGLTKYHRDIYFWKEPSVVNKPADVMVSPKMQASFMEGLEANGIESSVYIDDVQRLIDNERPVREPKASFAFDDYHSLEEIYAWLDTLAEAYPGTVTTVVGGSTYEGREIKGVKISFGDGNPAAVIEGGMHALEWATVACMSWFINEILTTDNSTVRDVIEQLDFYIFPTTNPDGYHYTWTTDRLWRKNRQPNPNSTCVGTDVNRNWGFHWGEYDASEDPCAYNHRGPGNFTQQEVITFADFLLSFGDELLFYANFHAYSQVLIFPYGVPNVTADNYDELYQLAEKGRDALRVRYGTEYTIGSTQEVFGPTTGNSIDWMQGVVGKRYNMVWELRDKGQYGYLLPTDQLIPASEEVWDSVVTVLAGRLASSTAGP
ncbi:zinc carboxypeptidase-like [Schistocerca gregaria]|uniref:zinc carboxypeptidase-like n=1 Tax=Schistocerca gregaria TaxID=7010 RepID=UPI00211DD331|nr:zinc carboxypeptidase-like [Schistocerca gregaria]XP_049860166.1 zinc carboxypeptidase-like [Schistocerca gregaria]